MTRKTVSMMVTVSVPADKSAQWARREVRHLIKEGVGYFSNAGDADGVTLRKLSAARRA